MTIMQRQKEKRSRATGRHQQYSSTAIILLSILLSSLVVVDVVRTSYAHDTNNSSRAKLLYPSNNDIRRNANIIINAINRNSNYNNDENNQMNHKSRIRRTRGERRELNNIFLPQQHPQEEVSSTNLLQLNKYRIDFHDDSVIAERVDGDSNTNSGNDENNKPTNGKVMPDLRIINGVVVSTSSL